MKIKLLLYSHSWFPRVGGVETVALSLARGLAAWGIDHPTESIEVTVVTNASADGPVDPQFPFRVVRRPSLRGLIRHIRSADVLHLAGPAFSPLLLAHLFGKPTVVEHHGYQSVCPNGLLLYQPDQSICPGHFMAGRYTKCVRCNATNLGWIGSSRELLLSFPRRWLCKLAAANVSVTEHVAARISLPRTRTIYHGIRDKCRDPMDTPLPGKNDPLKIGYVGRLVGGKGLLLLLNAASQIKNAGVSFCLTFIGDGPLRAHLESSARRLDLQDRVTFAGELRGDEFEAALQPIQVVAMPSEWEETAGLAAMEQMMRGGVVVAADIGGLGEVVGDAGLKFLVHDSDALAACLQKVYENPLLLKSLGYSAHSRAMQFFTLDRMIQDHVDLYARVTGR